MESTFEVLPGLSPEEQNTVLRSEIARLHAHLAQLERVNRQMEPLVAAARQAHLWDFASYEVTPDVGWVAIDRDDATRLMRALAGIDHWRPWRTHLEARPV